MPLPRFRIRTLMIAVAALAVILASIVTGVRLMKLRREYAVLAAENQALGEQDKATAEGARMVADMDEARVGDPSFPMRSKLNAEIPEYIAGLRASAVKDAARAEYHFALQRKYEQAARRPWLPVSPDPPGPK